MLLQAQQLEDAVLTELRKMLETFSYECRYLAQAHEHQQSPDVLSVLPEIYEYKQSSITTIRQAFEFFHQMNNELDAEDTDVVVLARIHYSFLHRFVAHVRLDPRNINMAWDLLKGAVLGYSQDQQICQEADSSTDLSVQSASCLLSQA